MDLSQLIRVAILSIFTLFPIGADAAISVLGKNVTAGSTNPETCGLTQSAAVGDVIVVIYTNATGTNTVTDNLGNTYSSIDYNATSTIAASWTKVTTAGVPTISISNSAAYYIFSNCIIYQGFTGTPTLDTAILNHFSGTTTSVSGSPITTNFNNEVLIFGLYLQANGAGGYVGSTGWTQETTSNALLADAIISTSGTTNNYSGTQSAAGQWYATLTGIYDSGGSSITHNCWTSSRTVVLPTAGSTSCWLNNRTFGTVDGSTVNYWQIPGRVFGVN